MDSREAREILKLYRAGLDDADPQFTEALEQTQRDPELMHWLDQHAAMYAAIRAKLKSIQPPADLKQRIVAEHLARTRVVPLSNPALWIAIAAGIVLLITFTGFWLKPDYEKAFPKFRDRMVRTAMRSYNMAMVTNNLEAIRQYQQAAHAPADYVLAKPLEQLQVKGCATVPWHEKMVSMICFDAGGTNLWLFVAARSGLPLAPNSSAPRFGKLEDFTVASWAANDKVYVLTAKENEEFLKKFL
ncbi:MAG TPA: hypothetical protein VH598_01550 [Verrucomicrobiae bacterium]|nr:hypothetical protein [Verrucomicrobiae bacterium]